MKSIYIVFDYLVFTLWIVIFYALCFNYSDYPMNPFYPILKCLILYFCLLLFFFQGETGNKRKKNRQDKTTAKKSKSKGGIKQN